MIIVIFMLENDYAANINLNQRAGWQYQVDSFLYTNARGCKNVYRDGGLSCYVVRLVVSSLHELVCQTRVQFPVKINYKCPGPLP